jgi:hypothetical protein
MTSIIIIIIKLLFAAETWGTVSDWTMVLVTIVTAIFLLVTLISQKKVQQTQNELFRIESIRFRESIRPILKYSLSEFQAKSSDEKKRMLTIEVTNETNSNALNISKFVAENDSTQQLFTTMGMRLGDNKRNHLTKGDNPLLFHFGVDLTLNDHHYFHLIFKYQDIADTKYQQRVICLYDEIYGIEIYPSLPEIITTKN